MGEENQVDCEVPIADQAESSPAGNSSLGADVEDTKASSETIALLLEVAQSKLQAQVDTISHQDTKVGVLMAFDAVIIVFAFGLKLPFWPKAVSVVFFLASAVLSIWYVAQLKLRNDPEPSAFYVEAINSSVEEARFALLIHSISAHDENKRTLEGRAKRIIWSALLSMAGLTALWGSYLINDNRLKGGGHSVNGAKAAARLVCPSPARKG